MLLLLLLLWWWWWWWGGSNNSKNDDNDDDDLNNNNKGDLLRSLITLEIGISKKCTMTIKQGQKEDGITNRM